MNKKHFALIGHPILHTISPFIHKRLFELSKIYAEYTVINIPPDNLEYSMPILNNLHGYNITIPHKQNIIKFLDTIDPKASLYNSVNTVKNSEKSTGYTTDAMGFLKSLEFENIKFGNKVLILGCGGVARVVAYEAVLAKAHVYIATRKESFSKAEALKNDILANFKDALVTIIFFDKISGSFDLLVNATPVGMYPNIDDSPLSEDIIIKCQNVFDTIYNPLETKLIKIAKANGVNALNGLSMLVWQAVQSHNIWYDGQHCKEDIFQLIEDSKIELKRHF